MTRPVPVAIWLFAGKVEILRTHFDLECFIFNRCYKRVLRRFCSATHNRWRALGDQTTTRLGFLHYTSDITKPFLSFKRFAAKEHSFTVSYLITSCGLSPETAISVSQKVNFQSSHKPDLLLTLLTNHGFTKTHISELVTRCPALLLANSEKTLLPKLAFFTSIGLPSSDLAMILSSHPTILNRSLENQLIPCYTFLKSVVLLHKNVIIALKRWPKMLGDDVQKNAAPNVAVLRELGVPQSFISLLITRSPRVVYRKSDKFNTYVKEAIGMGFNPMRPIFVKAIQVLSEMKKSTLEHKKGVYMRWGWSEDEIQLAFKKHPICMSLSEKNVTSAMNFLVNKMGWQSAFIARNPTVICFSLEKRIIPRCSVIEVLLLKGLIKKKLSLSTFLTLTEKKFSDKFVTKYHKDVPQLLNVYHGKMSLSEIGCGSEEICGMKQFEHVS